MNSCQIHTGNQKSSKFTKRSHYFHPVDCRRKIERYETSKAFFSFHYYWKQGYKGKFTPLEHVRNDRDRPPNFTPAGYVAFEHVAVHIRTENHSAPGRSTTATKRMLLVGSFVSTLQFCQFPILCFD
jgi:hypothetical protein